MGWLCPGPALQPLPGGWPAPLSTTPAEVGTPSQIHTLVQCFSGAVSYLCIHECVHGKRCINLIVSDTMCLLAHTIQASCNVPRQVPEHAVHPNIRVICTLLSHASCTTSLFCADMLLSTAGGTVAAAAAAASNPAVSNASATHAPATNAPATNAPAISHTAETRPSARAFSHQTGNSITIDDSSPWDGPHPGLAAGQARLGTDSAHRAPIGIVRLPASLLPSRCKLVRPLRRRADDNASGLHGDPGRQSNPESGTHRSVSHSLRSCCTCPGAQHCQPNRSNA